MRSTTAILAAAFLSTAVPATAQNSVGSGDQAGRSAESRSDWNDNPRLGLLGLLGLGGLLGLMRRQPSIHIDARQERRPTER